VNPTRKKEKSGKRAYSFLSAEEISTGGYPYPNFGTTSANKSCGLIFGEWDNMKGNCPEFPNMVGAIDTTPHEIY